MNSKSMHAADAGLKVLVFGDEDCDEYRRVAKHVEMCEACRQRLDEIAGPRDVEVEAREFLGTYPWQELSQSTDDDTPETSIDLSFLGPPSHPEMLGRLGRYEIERVIGSGGMGIVLKAFDTELNRPVAIKVLVEHLAHRGAARKRFAREAKAAAAIVHEHVVSIHNVETTLDLPFLVMQYVAGESLQARVDRDGPLEAKEILRIGIQTAAGLAAAHEQGVVHRDIKPANILLEEMVERVLLTDFGLARTIDDASLTHTGIVAGTPHYMSPEQANGEATDHRTDLFSLGSVLYFMATGHGPFRADRAMGVLHRICHAAHRPVGEIHGEIPDELSDIVDRLLEKKPSRRFASAVECKDALARVLATLQQRGSRKRNRFRRWLHRRRLPPVLAKLAWTVCLAAVAILIMPLIFLPTKFGLHDQPVDPLVARPVNAARIGQNVERPDERKTAASVPSAESRPPKIDLAAWAEESATDAVSLDEIANELGRLDAVSRNSTFFRSVTNAFRPEIQSLDQSLQHASGSFSIPRSTGTFEDEIQWLEQSLNRQNRQMIPHSKNLPSHGAKQ